MAGMSDVAENSILDLIFTAVTWANIAEDHVATPTTIVAWALHTEDIAENAAQNVSEAAYTSYVRKEKGRVVGGTGHTVTNESVSPASNVDFVAGTGGGETIDWFSVGKTSGTGATDWWFNGAVSPTIATGDGVTPRLTTASTIVLA